LADERRRYLEQQCELGGAEVILSTPLDAPARLPPVVVPAEPGAAAGEAADGMEDGEMPARKRSAARASRGQGAREKAKPAKSAGGEKWRKGAPPIPGPGTTVMPPEPMLLGNDLNNLDSLEEVAERIRTTYCCDLCPGRTNAVPGEGSPHARMVLVGEGPGATEDATGRPFVGAAGQLLNSILEAIELRREDVYITNIVKCRPPQNRKPLPDEIEACIPDLHRQLALLRPKVIVALGGTAGEALLGVRKSLGELRNKVHRYGRIPLVVTYHPAALLRNPNWKKPTWDDIRIARQLLDG
jgi:DNA polymerase